MDYAIQIDKLDKTFGWKYLDKARMPRGTRWLGVQRVHAVKGISLEVKAGQVYGFLGPNGAGKTTTIRMLLDLIRPNAGDVYMFGQHVRRQRAVLARVGSLVEGAYFYNFLTGKRNLEVLSLTANLPVDHKRIDQLLNQVGMAERSRRKVVSYSTGMKQRLGLAAALLGDPDLVILDEPTNGLDPHGIQEVRNFIRELVDEHGKTVFLSSHILNEVEQVCDRVAIINKGEVIQEGAVDDLLSAQAQLRIEAEPFDKARQLLQEHFTVTENGTAMLVNATREDTPQIIEKLVAEQIKIFAAAPHRQSLEDYFLAVTQEADKHVE